ncbi:energy transducer TonB [Phaeocystidibacter luteus]|uniref:Uncharacterized protein n=1 Tax=Phaeocystidibacter luteus TaxID=911197 RepID=A0A6N6RJ54_9FLAO|nr:energy transducer TonB [Phaeocystidibacter luteus]KAB2810371.1 hypothetical protein F8C67_07225 [Phaeocystidibacter luteus]
MKYAITDPCHEDWDKMKIGLISRHCDSCQKSVMDFTQMRREEIIEYLLSHADERVCGHIYPHQFDFKEEEILVAVKKYVRKNPKTNLAFYVLAIGAMMAASCSNGDSSSNPTPPQVQTIQSDTISDSTETSALDTLETSTASDTLEVKAAKKDIPLPANIPDIGEPVLHVLDGEVALSNPIDTPPVVDPEAFYPPEPQPDSVIAQFPEVQAEYPGGVEALFKFVRDSLEIPPHIAELEENVRVYVRFIISKKGKTSNVEIMRNTYPDRSLEVNVEKLILSMPDWTPGQINGQPVHSYMIIPIKIQNDRG